jgi:transposase
VTAIVRKERVVLFVDECHLLWGDALGYAWGPKGQRVELPITNEHTRQTYYGALNLLTGRAVTSPAGAGNGEQTVAFLKRLRQRFQGRPLLLIWDGAPYHRSEAVKTYLRAVNGDRPEAEWRIHCIALAPHAPEQNPMEDVWLGAKNHLRKMWFALKTFLDVNRYFTSFVECHCFEFDKLNWYGRLQLI